MMVIILAEYFCAISPAISIPTAPPPTMITLVALSILTIVDYFTFLVYQMLLMFYTLKYFLNLKSWD